MTYEDVTNVDSIGIATARDGIDVTGGHIDLVDDSKIRVGTGDDLQIYHSNNNSIIHAGGEGDLYIKGEDIFIQTNDNEASAYFYRNSGVHLYYDNSKKLETTGIGVSVSVVLLRSHKNTHPSDLH